MYTSLRNVQKELLDGRLSVTGLVRNYLSRIQEENLRLNAFLEVFGEEALAKALQQDQLIELGEMKRLTGMVVAIKDNICFLEHKVSAGSRMLQNFISQYTSTALQRLLDEGAIVIGRTNCDEFAMGSTNETSFYGPVRNPVNLDRVAGGSSGGSAAAVADNMCLAALGSDTGGSVRQPAAFCGVIGLKPSYGRISRYGLISYASSMDQIGILSHSLEDAALLLEIMAGPDEYDATVSRQSHSELTDSFEEEGPFSFVVLRETLEQEALNPEIREMFLAKVRGLEQQGHSVEWIDFPLFQYLVPTYYVLAMAEASSNLSRYSGVHFGFRAQDIAGDEDLVEASRTRGFGEEVKRRIMAGNFILTADYYESYFQQAQKIRRMICNETAALFSSCDGVLMPVSAQTAYSLGEQQQDPLAMLTGDRYTVLANLAGLPAISLPLGIATDGLPVGIQLLGACFEENSLFAMAQAVLGE